MQIELIGGRSTARVSPVRGGLVSEFVVDGRPVLYLDASTLADPAKNVRGGVPVLFPTPGKLAGDAWSRDGRGGAQKQHGFARNRAWEVVAEAESTASVRLAHDGDDGWPWPCTVAIHYVVAGTTLSITTWITSRSADRMPYGLGFHPYFALRDKRSFRLESAATRAFDNVGKTEVPFEAAALDLTAGEVDLHLHDHGASSIAFACDGLPTLTIDASPEFSHWVLWSLPDKPFVCVEPWTCPGNAMNSGERLLWLAPGETRSLAVSLRA